MADKNTETQEARINEIDRIREIITGPVVNQSSRQYKELKDAIDQVRVDFSKQIAEARAQTEASGQYFYTQQEQQSAAIQLRLEAMEKTLRDELQSISNRLSDSKVDRTSLGDELIRLGEQLRKETKK